MGSTPSADRITYVMNRPTVIHHGGETFHESLLRSWSLLQHVKEMLARSDSAETVLQLIDLVERAPEVSPWSKPSKITDLPEHVEQYLVATSERSKPDDNRLSYRLSYLLDIIEDTRSFLCRVAGDSGVPSYSHAALQERAATLQKVLAAFRPDPAVSFPAPPSQE